MALTKCASLRSYKDSNTGYATTIDDYDHTISIYFPDGCLNESVVKLLFDEFEGLVKFVQEVKNLMNEEGYFNEQ